ncbi:hypothetical protein JCM10212_005173 [Sporobolomyces blumeae]
MSGETYEGANEVLVLGIDVGTTSSAVSIAHLTPHLVPTVRTVTSWPSHPLDSKVPSLVAFPTSTLPSTASPICGAECLTPGARLKIAANQYRLCEFFKLHLHPQSLKWDLNAVVAADLSTPTLDSSAPRPIVPDFSLPPLPDDIDIAKVYATFVRYLVDLARTWFEANTLGGSGVWTRLSPSMEIVMGIPDGWDEHQCEVLKKAVVSGEVLASQEEANERVEFLRESEASVHFALKSGEAGVDFTVTYVGGSTCDNCMYHVDAVYPKLGLREVKPLDSVQAGGIFVDRAAKALVETKLGSSRFHTPSTVSTIISAFETKTKRLFKGGSQTNHIKFGGPGDSDAQVGVRAGSVEVASTFDFCTNEILASVKSQVKMGTTKSKASFCVCIVREHRGDGPAPTLARDPEGFATCCTISASLPPSIVRVKTGLEGMYAQVEYGVELFVATTVLKARVTWKDEQDNRQTDPATIVPEEPSALVDKDTTVGRRLPADNIARSLAGRAA